MIRALRSMPIRGKVSLVIVLTCTMVLVTSFTLQVAAQWRARRAEYDESLRATADAVGGNCAGGIIWVDEQYANDALRDMTLVSWFSSVVSLG